MSLFVSTREVDKGRLGGCFDYSWDAALCALIVFTLARHKARVSDLHAAMGFGFCVEWFGNQICDWLIFFN